LRYIIGAALALPRPLDRIGFSPALRRAIHAEYPDIVHAHGLWQMPLLYGARSAFRREIPFMVAPRGMLAPVALRFSSGPKKIFGLLLQNRVLTQASAFHATAESEYEDIRAFGFDQPVAVVPNGVDLPLIKNFYEPPRRTILSLGRIHPKKGLDTLIASWAMIAPRFANWSLRIVGPDERGHAAELAALVAELAAPRTEICNPAYGNDKWIEYRKAGLFVLPTKSENFAVTVAEALAAEVPVISTKGAPWAGLEHNRCGWWIDHGVEPLATTLATALSLDDSVRKAMGARGREWVDRDFSWDSIASDMLDVYRWLIFRGKPPSCVRTD
jgi:glycosyltransferase involved in cell wall biosynthesis